MKDFVLINFGECFKSMRKASYTESFYTFLTRPDEVEKYVELIEKMPEAKIMIQSSPSDGCLCHDDIKVLNLFDPELQLINNKPIMKNKRVKLKKFKIET